MLEVVRPELDQEQQVEPVVELVDQVVQSQAQPACQVAQVLDLGS